MTWVLYILMGGQILFGCAYFVSNFGAEQQFRENWGSLLPMGIVCLAQLILAAFCLWYVLGKFGFRESKWVRSYVCAFFLTVPYLLQMHMARLIWSAAFSVFLWLIGLILETAKSGLSRQRAFLLLIAWFLYGVICPDGLWLGAFLLSGIFFFSGRGREESGLRTERKKGRTGFGAGFRFGAAALLTAVLIFVSNLGLNAALPGMRTLYRENTFGVAAVSRLVWPNFGKNYFFWSEEVKAVLPEDEAVWISWRADLVGEEFFPSLEEAYGRKKATKLCLEMGMRCLKDRTKETVSEIGRDLKDYFLIPFTIERNLKGEGVSLTAWNYGRMREHTPVLVKYYYRYGIFELPLLLLCSFLLWCFKITDQTSQFLRRKAAGEETAQRRGDGRKIPVQGRFVFYILILYTVWYTMRSNLPVDYKAVLPSLFVWYLASVGGLLCKKRESEREA